jgi:hypothetical protein
VEADLVFAGFLIFFCPLKKDSAQAISMLNNSSHRVSAQKSSHIILFLIGDTLVCHDYW